MDDYPLTPQLIRAAEEKDACTIAIKWLPKVTPLPSVAYPGLRRPSGMGWRCVLFTAGPVHSTAGGSAGYGVSVVTGAHVPSHRPCVEGSTPSPAFPTHVNSGRFPVASGTAAGSYPAPSLSSNTIPPWGVLYVPMARIAADFESRVIALAKVTLIKR